MDLLSLLYVSRSASFPGAAHDNVEAIVATARARNPGYGLTGALLFRHDDRRCDFCRRRNRCDHFRYRTYLTRPRRAARGSDRLAGVPCLLPVGRSPRRRRAGQSGQDPG